MGKKLDAAEKAGGTALVALGVLERLATKWRAWRDARAEAAALRKWEKQQKVDRWMQKVSDDANRKAGTPPCPSSGCQRPKWHSGEHGETPEP